VPPKKENIKLHDVFNAIFSFMNTTFPFEPFSMYFMKRALLGILLLAPLCAAMGVQVVNFGMAFFSDAISHSAFTGVALGLLLSVDPSITMIIFGLVLGLAITQVRHESDFSTDTVVGVFFSGTVALGIVIISAQKGLVRNLQSYLYGDILTLSNMDIAWLAVSCVVIGCFLVVSYNKLIMSGMHRSLAHSRGVAVKRYDFMFAMFLAFVVMLAVRAVGLLLVTAMLIVPAAAGRNLANNLCKMFWFAIGISIVSGVVGLVMSYYLDSAAGASIILVSCMFFLFTQLVRFVARKK